jgi:WD40 repeat protein
MQHLQGHARTVTSLAFSRNGRWLASGSLDHTIKLWSLPEGRELTTLRDHHKAVNSVQFHPEGSVLASGSHDGQVKLWNFDLQVYILRGCRILSGYLPYNPYVADEDRALCQDVEE